MTRKIGDYNGGKHSPLLDGMKWAACNAKNLIRRGVAADNAFQIMLMKVVRLGPVALRAASLQGSWIQVVLKYSATASKCLRRQSEGTEFLPTNVM